MKKVMIVVAMLNIGYGIYSIYQGKHFNDQIALFVSGIVLIGMTFILDKKKRDNH